MFDSDCAFSWSTCFHSLFTTMMQRLKSFPFHTKSLSHFCFIMWAEAIEVRLRMTSNLGRVH